MPPSESEARTASVERAVAEGGCSISRLIGAGTTNSTLIKGTPGQVYAIFASNINANEVYLKLYNKATAPTVGTDVPVMTLLIPGNAAGAGFVLPIDLGAYFSLGIGIGITGAAADNDTTAVSASEQIINVLYK